MATVFTYTGWILGALIALYAIGAGVGFLYELWQERTGRKQRYDVWLRAVRVREYMSGNEELRDALEYIVNGEPCVDIGTFRRLWEEKFNRPSRHFDDGYLTDKTLEPLSDDYFSNAPQSRTP